MSARITNGWIVGDIYGITVRHDEIKRPAGKPYIPMKNTHKGALHMTQGHSLQVALDTLHAKYASPLLTIGEMQIVQNRPLGVQQAALVDDPTHSTNSLAFVQIEMCGFTGGELAAKDETHHAMDSYQLLESTRIPAAAALAFLHEQNIIPLQKAFPWRDDCKDMTGIPASLSNSYRKGRAWLNPDAVGWFYHLHVPFNTHYDCGELDFEQLKNEAEKFLAGADVPVVEMPPPSVPTPPASVPVIHKVQPGESFYSIARQYKVRPDVLALRNNMTYTTVLLPGMLLTIPQ